MKRALSFALVAFLTMTCQSFADKPEGGERPEGKARAGKPGERAGGPRAGGPEGRNPEQMVAKMMETFDKDGDQKLDLSELTAMMKSMRERRGQGGPEGAQRRRPGGAGQGDAARPGGRRGRPGGEPGKEGGERPKRPAAEKE